MLALSFVPDNDKVTAVDILCLLTFIFNLIQKMKLMLQLKPISVLQYNILHKQAMSMQFFPFANKNIQSLDITIYI